MNEIAIEAAGLGKRFQLGARRHATLFHRLFETLAGGATRPLWAIRGVDLVVSRGECLGIIGPNGAGKSTLLSLLAGLLTPTEGSVRVRGRISPFFSIGAGLYSELTVLDNIRLSGALFGMTARQLRNRLDSIVDFGGLDDYLYARLGELSAGYQARVIFSTALHSDVDILLIDEVFAVGDAAFAAQCLDRMTRLIQGEGKTMVLASHSMDLINSACSRTLFLERGRMRMLGPSKDVVENYISRVEEAHPA